MKVIFRQIDAGAALGDEGPGMAELANGGVKLMAISGSEPDTGDGSLGESFQKFGKPGQRLAGEGNKVVNGAVDDGVGRAQRSPQIERLIVSKIGWRKKRNGGRNEPSAVGVEQVK